MSTPSSSNFLLGAGKVLFDRWTTAGASTGLRHLGNVPKFELSQETTKITKNSAMYAAKSTLLEVVSKISSSLTLTLDEIVPENIAMAFLGEEGVITQVAGAVTDESHTAHKSRFLQIDSFGVKSTGLILTDAAGTVTYLAGTDYTLDETLLRAGMIYIPESSSIVEAATVLVDYTRPAGAYPSVAGAAVGSVEGYMFFAGDPTKGPCYTADFWHVSISPNGALGFISEELTSFDISVSIWDDREKHPSYPQFRAIKIA